MSCLRSFARAQACDCDCSYLLVWILRSVEALIFLALEVNLGIRHGCEDLVQLLGGVSKVRELHAGCRAYKATVYY
jgi:hypothetical protein